MFINTQELPFSQQTSTGYLLPVWPHFSLPAMPSAFVQGTSNVAIQLFDEVQNLCGHVNTNSTLNIWWGISLQFSDQAPTFSKARSVQLKGQSVYWQPGLEKGEKEGGTSIEKTMHPPISHTNWKQSKSDFIQERETKPKWNLSLNETEAVNVVFLWEGICHPCGTAHVKQIKTQLKVTENRMHTVAGS